MPHLEHDYYPYSPENERLEQLSARGECDIPRVINDYLLQTHGPALEIGGPTKQGYLLLNNVEFPNKLVISNAYPETEDVARMDVTTRLPFENSSLGCIISSCLPVVDLSNPLRDAREINLVIRSLNTLADDFTNSRYDRLPLDEFTNISPRTAFIKESCRVLETGGLLVIKSLLGSELRIINQLGFEELASVQFSSPKNDSIWIQKEYIFRLNNPNKYRAIGQAAINNALI